MTRLTDIQKYYSSPFVTTFVPRGIDLEIRKWEFVSLMSPSGAGKSALLHILGLDPVRVHSIPHVETVVTLRF